MDRKVMLESKGKVLQHFKGNKYMVDNIAIHTETGDIMVVYHNIENEELVYVRPIEMFYERVPEEKQVSNVTGQIYRFELVNNG